MAVAGDPDGIVVDGDARSGARRRRARRLAGRRRPARAASARPRRSVGTSTARRRERSPTLTRPSATRASPCPSSARRQRPGRPARRRAARRPSRPPRRSSGGAAGGSASDALEQPRVLLAGAHVGARQQRAREGGVGRHAERSRSSPARGRAGASAVARSGAVGDHLGQHRVVVGADHACRRAMPESTRTPGPAGSR